MEILRTTQISSLLETMSEVVVLYETETVTDAGEKVVTGTKFLFWFLSLGIMASSLCQYCDYFLLKQIY